MSAAAKLDRGFAAPGPGAAAGPSPQAITAPMAPIFRTISALCVRAPAPTPRQLTATRIATARAATAASEKGTPASGLKYRAKVTAQAAIPPVWMTSSSAQP